VKTTGKVLPLPYLFQSAKKETPRHHVIELFPPFVLQNLLACDIDFKIIVPNNKHKDVEVMVGVIQEGSKVNVHIFEEEKPVYASIRLPGTPTYYHHAQFLLNIFFLIKDSVGPIRFLSRPTYQTTSISRIRRKEC